ncbi:MAG: carboxypeptidase-like regulatory domain-containing protein, partial [Bacteroidia bacterium]|nr:carboxypeptidase-like regulatory domain-containing protein [Bacteroidia bacterium]
MMGKIVATLTVAMLLCPGAWAQEGGEIRGRKGERKRSAETPPPPTTVRPAANATAPTGQTITGVVIDAETGEGMIGATVTVRNTDNAVVHGAVTDV